VALDIGEVLFRGDDVFGDTVNTAARIEGITGPGQVVFSGAVFSAMNKSEIRAVNMGLRKFKGLKYPLRVFRVMNKLDEKARRRKVLRKAWRDFKAFLIGIVILVIAIVMLYFLVMFLLSL